MAELTVKYTAPLPAGFTSGTLEIKRPTVYIDAAGRKAQAYYRATIGADRTLTDVQTGGPLKVIAAAQGDPDGGYLDWIETLNVDGLPTPLRQAHRIPAIYTGAGELDLHQPDRTAKLVDGGGLQAVLSDGLTITGDGVNTPLSTLGYDAWSGRFWRREAGQESTLDMTQRPDRFVKLPALDLTNYTVGNVASGFNAVFEGIITPKYKERYTLSYQADDGIRVWLDDLLVVDNWPSQKIAQDLVGTADLGLLVIDRPYRVRVAWWQWAGVAGATTNPNRLYVGWRSASQGEQPIPTIGSVPLSNPVQSAQGLGVSATRLTADGTQIYTGNTAPELEFRRGGKTWVLTGFVALGTATTPPAQTALGLLNTAFIEVARTSQVDALSVVQQHPDLTTNTGWAAVQGAGNPVPLFANSASGITMSYQGNAGDAFGYLDTGYAAQPWDAGQVTVLRWSNANGPASNDVVIGIADPVAKKWLWLAYNPNSNSAFRILYNNGNNESILASGNLPVTYSNMKLALLIKGDTLIALYDIGNGWQIGCTTANPLGTDTANYAGYHWVVGGSVASNATQPTTISDVQIGAAGGIGWRDPTLVTNADGSVYHDAEGYPYVYATAAGVSVPSSHAVVYRVDWNNKKLIPTASLLWQDGSAVLGHHAGQLIHRADGNWTLLASSWGKINDPIKIIYANSTENLLSGRHVLQRVDLNVPTTTSVYDPALWLDNGVWKLAYSETSSAMAWSTFNSAFATSPDLATWTVQARDTTATSRHEGQKVVVTNGTTNIVAGGDTDMRVLSEAMQPLGNLNVTYASSMNGSIPHAAIWQAGEDLRMLTFDGATNGGGADTRGKVVWLSN